MIFACFSRLANCVNRCACFSLYPSIGFLASFPFWSRILHSFFFFFALVFTQRYNHTHLVSMWDFLQNNSSPHTIACSSHFEFDDAVQSRRCICASVHLRWAQGQWKIVSATSADNVSVLCTRLAQSISHRRQHKIARWRFCSAYMRISSNACVFRWLRFHARTSHTQTNTQQQHTSSASFRISRCG